MPPSFQPRPHRQIIGSAFELVNQNSSAANQWFGRTGCTSVALGVAGVVSTALVNSDSIFSLVMQPMVANSNATSVPFGVYSIQSGVSFTIGTVASCTATQSYTAHWILFNPAGS